ncbi:Maf family protein [Neptuniibacter halophilus]|uniref:Maf family protein n=1 Tax=Neptuniibacter halophilus TaxID=651666 RepID=UPI0025743C1E|nr:Maf family protein [Neptuniibacter halophilus]
MNLILASASPRRKELLRQIGVQFNVKPVDICEDLQEGEEAEAYVRRLALEKAEAGLAHCGSDVTVLGSDTTVVVDGEVMGKPLDRDDAVATLQRLSGRSHQVMTAVALVSAEQSQVVVVKTDVCFRQLDTQECLDYWETGEPADKAGAYGIQGMGAVFVEKIKGSYSAVVGLPLAETAALLKQAGIPIWHSE